MSGLTPEDSSVAGLDGAPAATRNRREDVLVCILIVASFCLFAVGRKAWRALAPAPTEERCEQLAERYVEQASRARHDKVDSQALSEAQARRGVERLSDVTRCEEELTDAQVSCGIAASNVDEIERCLQP